jgi:hypothetical protein
MTQEDQQLGLSPRDIDALEAIANELDGARASTTFSESDLCARYKQIKPILEKAIPIIRLIPKFGKQLAEAIEMLMRIADQFCPA